MRFVTSVGLVCLGLGACAKPPYRVPPPVPSEPSASPPAAAEPDVWEIEVEDDSGPWCPPKPVPLAKPLASVPVSPGDPKQGRFSLAEATSGVRGEGQLFARIRTEQGDIECELWPHRAPLTVANFVGLARGLRPFVDPDTKAWVTRPAYDDAAFHRVIPGFMIQGGDPLRTGAGDSGYVIPDEVWQGASHDDPGLLCMANKGPNTGGMQFFITDGVLAKSLSYLDGSYTIFGQCIDTDVVEHIAKVEAYGDRPVSPPRIESVRIFRQIPR